MSPCSVVGINDDPADACGRNTTSRVVLVNGPDDAGSRDHVQQASYLAPASQPIMIDHVLASSSSSGF